MEDSIKIVCPSCNAQLEVDEKEVVTVVSDGSAKSDAKVVDGSSVGEGAGTGTGVADAGAAKAAAESEEAKKGDEEGV